MTIETIWYALVGLYVFWITLVATAVTVFAWRAFTTVKRMLVSPPPPKAQPKFNPANLPRRHRK